LHPGQNDPHPLRGPEAHSQATLARSARTAMAMAGHPPGTKEGRCFGAEEEGERGWPDRKLTENSPVGSAWPEDGRRRAIWAAELGLLRGKSGESAVISGTPARFFGRGGRGQCRGPSQHIGGAGGEHGMAALGGGHGGSSSFTGSVHGGEEGRPGRGKKRRGHGSLWRPAASSGGLLGGQSEQEVARPHPGGLHAPASCDSTKKTKRICK
jgi:hypothetical protein